MPIIQYKCLDKKCNHEYEVFYTSQSAREAEEKIERCPECGSTRKEKLVSKSTSFVLKGSGYYSTDNKKQ
jgi:putative FmdB family regulatory protein